jgi:hypothetical protein
MPVESGPIPRFPVSVPVCALQFGQEGVDSLLAGDHQGGDGSNGCGRVQQQ